MNTRPPQTPDVAAAGPAGLSPAPTKACFWVLAAAAITVVLVRFPPAQTPPLAFGLLAGFDPGKLAIFCQCLGLLALINGSAAGLGRLVRRFLLPAAAGVPEVPLQLGIGLVVLADLVLLLAAIGRLERWLLATLLVAPLALHALARRPAIAAQAATTAPAERRLWLAALALVGLMPLLTAFLPDYGWDAWVYHLTIPERTLAGQGPWATPLSLYSAMPATAQMLYVFPVAFDLLPVTKLLHAELGLLCILVTMSIARRFSLPAAWLGAIVLVADPLLFWEMGTAYADLFGCYLSLLAAAVIAHRPADERSLWLGGILAGAATATSYRFAILPAVLVGYALCSAGAASVRLRRAALLGAAAALALSPWLVRNAVQFGNPVAPAAQSAFYAEGEEYFPPVVVEQNLQLARGRGPGRSLEEWAFLPWRLFAGKTAGGAPRFSFRVGVLYLVAALASLLAWRRLPSPSRRLALVALAGVLIWFASGLQESRYVLPFLVLLAPVGGEALASLLPRRRVLQAAAVSLLVVSGGATQWRQVRKLPWSWGYALGTLSHGAFRSQEPALVAGDRLRTLLGEEDRLLLLFEPRSFFFAGLDFLPYHVNEGSPVLQLVHSSASAAALHAELRRLGVTHLLVNRGARTRYPTQLVDGYSRDDLAADLATIEELVARHSLPLFSDRGVAAYALLADASSVPALRRDEARRLTARGRQAAAAGRLGEAARLLAAATDAHPGSATAHRFRANVAFLLDDREGAREALDRALAIDPANELDRRNRERLDAKSQGP